MDTAPPEFKLTQQRLVEQRPLLLKGLAASWPACGLWSRTYLAARYPAAVVQVYVRGGAAGVGRGPLPTALAAVETLQQHGGEDVFIANTPVAAVDPALLVQLQRPVPETGGDAGNLWIGQAGHVSHAHYDSHPGVLVALVGRKRVRLWPPGALPHADTGPVNHAGATGPHEPYCDTELRPGDALLIPTYWWHEVHSPTDSTAVNFWYYPLADNVRLKWTHALLWPVTRRELHLAARALAGEGPRWALLHEDTLRRVYGMLARGGAEPLLLYDEHRARLVDAIQQLLNQWNGPV